VDINSVCNMTMCRVLVGERGGRRLLGRPERRWVDNTRTSTEAIGWKDLHVDIVSCTHGNEPYGSIKCGYFLD
jgi:hypothetical protein